MQSNYFMSHEILPSWDTFGKSEIDKTVSSDHTVNTPSLCGDVETVLPDLEPLEISDVLLECVVDFGSARRRDSIREG